MFKKILLMVILVMSVVGCEVFDPKGWKKANEDWEERGVKCYRESTGHAYCKDRYGNRVY